MSSSALLRKPAGESPVRQVPGEEDTVTAASARTAGSLAVTGAVVPPGRGPGVPGLAVRAATVGEVVILDVSGESPPGRVQSALPAGQRVLVFLARRGAWRLTPPGGRGSAVTAPAGSFALWPAGPPPLLAAGPGTAGTILALPPAAVGPAPGGVVTGPARSAEARLLTAHARALSDTAASLSPAGAAIARDTLLRLTRALLSQQGPGPAAGPALALARAAMAAADGRLADPDLTPAMLARQLHVSVRTLHRAFAAAGEPAGAYIRRRRLEQARADLTAAPGRANVAEVAARWQFADASHLTRAFKKRYGQPPARFARSA